jgi:hypothetical protein
MAEADAIRCCAFIPFDCCVYSLAMLVTYLSAGEYPASVAQDRSRGPISADCRSTTFSKGLQPCSAQSALRLGRSAMDRKTVARTVERVYPATGENRGKRGIGNCGFSNCRWPTTSVVSCNLPDLNYFAGAVCGSGAPFLAATFSAALDSMSTELPVDVSIAST